MSEASSTDGRLTGYTTAHTHPHTQQAVPVFNKSFTLTEPEFQIVENKNIDSTGLVGGSTSWCSAPSLARTSSRVGVITNESHGKQDTGKETACFTEGDKKEEEN